jgi:phosphatidylserine/phosphatidylglycerophosphate/cardiolipin synthase-like enzyme
MSAESNEATLSSVPTAELRRLHARVTEGRLRVPLTKAALGFARFEKLVEPLAPFYALERPALLAVLEAVLAERGRHDDRLALVWSGPDEGASSARDTAQVLADLVASAERSVLIAGYAVEKRSGAFVALAKVMAERKVRVSMYLDPDQILKRKDRLHAPLERYVEEAIGTFVRRSFDPGAPIPEIYVDRRVLEEESFGENGFPRISLHAKCVVVDDARALVTSANFTERGEKRNVEAGVLVRDVGFASGLAGQFRRLGSLGAMVRVR